MVGFFFTHGSHLFDAKLYRSCSSDKHGLLFNYLLLIFFLARYAIIVTVNFSLVKGYSLLYG